MMYTQCFTTTYTCMNVRHFTANTCIGAKQQLQQKQKSTVMYLVVKTTTCKSHKSCPSPSMLNHTPYVPPTHTHSKTPLLQQCGGLSHTVLQVSNTPIPHSKTTNGLADYPNKSSEMLEAKPLATHKVNAAEKGEEAGMGSSLHLGSCLGSKDNTNDQSVESKSLSENQNQNHSYEQLGLLRVCPHARVTNNTDSHASC